MFKPQIAWIKKFLGKLFDTIRPKAKLAIQIVNFLKSFVESPIVGEFVRFTPTNIDDMVLAQARMYLPKIAYDLKVTDMILKAGAADDVINSLINYLQKQSLTARAMFYRELAAALTEAMSDGKVDTAEAMAISQMVYKEYKREQNR